MELSERAALPEDSSGHYLKAELYEQVRTNPAIFEFLQVACLDGLWYWDLESPDHEWLSPRFKQVLGYSDEEAPNSSAWWRERIFAEDLQVALDNFHRHCADPSHPYDQVVRYRHRDGSTVWIRCRGVAIRDHLGKPVRMLGAHTNVTAMKAAESEIRAVQEAEPNIRLTVDSETALIQDCDHSFAEHIGLAPNEAIGRSLFDFCAAGRLGEARTSFASLAVGRTAKSVCFALRHKNGAPTILLVASAERRASSLLLACREVGYLWKVANVEVLIQGFSDGIILTDREGRIAAANEAAERMFGYERDELAGQPVEVLVPGPLASRHRAQRERYLNSPYCRPGNRGNDLPARRKDGSQFPAQVSLSPIAAVEGTFILAAVTDMTARRDLEEQLQRKNEELQIESQRAGEASLAKSQFLAAMSHEIRTPMNAILGMADLLAESELDAEQRQYVDVFRNAGHNLLALINGVLDLSKIEAGHFELERIPFRLDEVIQRTMSLVGDKARKKDLRLKVDLREKTPPAVIGDPTRLQQVLLNLLSNAVKFTEAGSVTLTAEPADADSPGRIRFSVTDTGIGIAKEKRKAIFEDFTQADSSTTRKYGGTGLGLSIARRLTQLMGGELTVESQLGKGSSFRFTVDFEVIDGAQSQPQRDCVSRVDGVSHDGDAARDALSADRTPLRILVAEDSPDNQKLIRAYLAKSSHLLDFVEDGEAAVDQFFNANYDLVLMDMQMPVMDGLEATRRIRAAERERGRSTPVIALTANALSHDVEASLAAGCAAHLSKPISKTELLSAIGRYGRPAEPRMPEERIAVEIPDGLEELVPGYLESRKQDLPALFEALSRSDWDRIRFVSHDMKGTGTSYGFPEVTRIGAQMEDAAKESDGQSVERQLRELASYLDRVTLVPSTEPEADAV